MFVKLIAANFKEMSRDRMQIFWFLLFPVIFVLVFGLLFSNVGKDESGQQGGPANNMIYDIAVATSSGAPLSGVLKAYFRETFELTGNMFKLHTGDRTAEAEAFANGKRHALILVPDDFIDTVQRNQPVSIDLFFDETHKEVLFAASEVVKAVEKTANGLPRLIQWKFTTSLEFQQKKPSNAGGEKKEVSFNQLDSFLPGVLALTLMQLGLFGSMRILNLKAQNTLKTLGTTPMPRHVFLASEIVLRLIWSLAQGGIIVVLSHLVFNVNLSGSWLAIIGWIVLGTSSFIAMGYMLTTFVKTPESCNTMMQVIQFPMMFLSGIFIPPALMPEFIRPVVYFMPLAYLADGLKHSMAGIASTYGNALNLTVLGGILILCLAVTILRFRWD